MLDKKNLKLSYSLIKATYNYINKTIDIEMLSWRYSFMGHLAKFDLKVYDLIMTKCNLNKKKIIFFDGVHKSVVAVLQVALKVFNLNRLKILKGL